jgi:hypothetical protein
MQSLRSFLQISAKKAAQGFNLCGLIFLVLRILRGLLFLNQRRKSVYAVYNVNEMTITYDFSFSRCHASFFPKPSRLSVILMVLIFSTQRVVFISTAKGNRFR